MIPFQLSGAIVLSILAGASVATAAAAKPLTLVQLWRLDAIYRDTRHGVTFRYPSVWKAETQFGYHAPALSEAELKPIAGFGYEEGGFPRDGAVGPYSATNLEGVGIVYSAQPTDKISACRSMAAGIAGSASYKTVRLGGRLFSLYATGEAGMSQFVAGDLYATYADHTCFLFETSVAAASAKDNDVQELRTEQDRYIAAHLLGIMKTVRIVPPEARRGDRGIGRKR